LTGDVYIISMSEEQQSLTGRKPLPPIPEPGLNEASLESFVPHRPIRPRKTEGGKVFNLKSEFEPAG
jgi:excinuclease ABC subunit B